MIGAQVPLPPLRPEQVKACCDPSHEVREHLDLLRWLVWLPLLSREELARVSGRHTSTLWSHLTKLRKLGLIDQVELTEPDWPRRHRFYITDLGLYVLAALHPEPLSVHRLAMSYPVTRADLVDRLARPRVHLPLAELVTRLLAEHPPGYQLTSYQQPYKESYLTLNGERHTLLFDAAFLLQTPQGTDHAFYVIIDQPEHLFSQREIKHLITKLLALRQHTHRSLEVMPHVLILSSQERFAHWAEHLNYATLAQATALLDVSALGELPREYMDLSCLIADCSDLHAGAFAPIWTPFHPLIEQRGDVLPHQQTGIESFLERVASPRLVERFSQYFTFRRAITSPLAARRRRLTRYVNICLPDEAAPLITRALPQAHIPASQDGYETTALCKQLLDGMYGDPETRHAMSAFLTLALSDQQKELLAYLVRHPYLTQEDLVALLHFKEERLLMRQITPLLHLNLLKVYPWREAPTWRERERFYLSELALRFMAQRHGLSPAYYLEPSYADTHPPPGKEDPPKQQTFSPLSRTVTWTQRGAWGLRGKHIWHTNGIYRCIRRILKASGTGVIRYWKSARESQRQYLDPIESDQDRRIRPDAELLYIPRGETIVRSLLIEYDRDTTTRQQLYDKFSCYEEYVQSTRTLLPPILMITQNERSVHKIRQAVAEARATSVSILIVIEEQIVHQSLYDILAQGTL